MMNTKLSSCYGGTNLLDAVGCDVERGGATIELVEALSVRGGADTVEGVQMGVVQ